MNNYTDFQNYVLNEIVNADLQIGNFKPGMNLLDCIDKNEYKKLYNDIIKAGLQHLVLKDYINNNESGSRSGLCAIAVADPTTGAVGVSYRGTENLEKLTSENQIDMVDNIQTAILGTSDQKREAIDFFEKNMNGEGNNYLFGHSKGGELASEVYAKHYKKVKGIHLYNPQPINSVKLTVKQRNAFKSEKVDVIVIDGDVVSSLGDKDVFGDRIRYMKNNGTQNGFFGPHLLESASFDKQGNIIIEPDPYSKYAEQKAVCTIAAGVIFSAQKGLLPKVTFCVLVIAKVYEFFVKDLPNMIEVFSKTLEKAIEKILSLIDAAKEKINEIITGLKQFINSIVDTISNWYNEHFNAGYSYADANRQIMINTSLLRTYANRLRTLNRKIASLDKRIDGLYWKVNVPNQWRLQKADMLLGHSWRIDRCIYYLEETANEFEKVEQKLINYTG
ncbi:MAG: DUF2974 domain-containing protein [Clostridia bacterium]|nr:DUF2974 domain-containing protein [Clostridia bacterium]